jgi:hypothetical protein
VSLVLANLHKEIEVEETGQKQKKNATQQSKYNQRGKMLTEIIFTFHCFTIFADSTLSSSNRMKNPITA